MHMLKASLNSFTFPLLLFLLRSLFLSVNPVSLCIFSHPLLVGTPLSASHIFPSFCLYRPSFHFPPLHHCPTMVSAPFLFFDSWLFRITLFFLVHFSPSVFPSISPYCLWVTFFLLSILFFCFFCFCLLYLGRGTLVAKGVHSS